MKVEAYSYLDYLIEVACELEKEYEHDIANIKLLLLYDLKEARAVIFVTKKEMLMIAPEILKASSVDDLQERLRRLRDG